MLGTCFVFTGYVMNVACLRGEVIDVNQCVTVDVQSVAEAQIDCINCNNLILRQLFTLPLVMGFIGHLLCSMYHVYSLCLEVSVYTTL